MPTLKTLDKHVAAYEAWFEKYPAVFESEIVAIQKQMQTLPENISGIEIGLGTGRFAKELGIKEGIEPIEELAELARERGIEVMDAKAKNLPYKDLHFDFVLFVTIEHLDNLKDALKEAYRVLKNDGSLILCFIEKNSIIGERYENKRNNSFFYKHAQFYTVKRVTEILKTVKFKDPVFTQTLFDDLDKIKTVEQPKFGTGEGSFIIVRAKK